MAVDYSKFIYAGTTATPYINNYNKQAAKQKENLNTRINQLDTARTSYQKSQKGIYDAYKKQLASEQSIAENKSNAEYDASAKQNYLNYMQAIKNTPEQLNAQGIRGGASESSIIRLGTNYGTNVANNEAARGTALAALRQQYAETLADYDKEYRNLLANYDETYNQNRRTYQDNYQNTLNSLYATAQENQQKWEQQQLDNDLTRFASAIKGQFTSKKGYENLIEKLKKSKDPNKTAKIMLTRQAMNEWLEKQEEKEKENKKSSGGRSSGRRYRSGGGGGGGGGVDSSANSTPSSSDVNRTNYTKANLSKIQNYKPSRTTTRSSSTKSNPINRTPQSSYWK